MKEAYKIFRELEEQNKRANPYKFYDKDELIDEILKDEEEIERLNNIINELEKWLDEEYQYADKHIFPGSMAGVAMGQINRTKNKLHELKGEDKE